ncbi:MAG: type II toxin-antitoxin system VapC family toxin [Candidatus Hydrogenedentes bacterium]|nr:type II toxin-antitoxin system VapC family toxin [Candidatus Hydrogenedentota bacterium]
MSKPSVYIETSVVSYLAAAPSRDLLAAAHQQVTSDWWENVLPRCTAYVSPVVLEEISKGDRQQARIRLAKLARFSVLEVNPDVHDLANLYFAEINIPDKAMADAYHLALATWHGMDYLVSWNCRHIASGRVRSILERVNSKRGIASPVICTPEELMEV